MAARQAPQLRIFRNDFDTRSAALTLRLVGTKSNRDAVGARVVVETDRMRKSGSCRRDRGFSRSIRRSCSSVSGPASASSR